MDYSKNLSQIWSLIYDSSRMQILKLCSKRPYNLSELKRELGIAYKNIFPHIDKLEKNNLISTNRETRGKGKPTLITTNRNEVYKLLDVLFMDGVLEHWFSGETTEENKLKILHILKNKPVLFRDLVKKLDEDVSEKIIEILINELLVGGLLKIQITKKGKKKISS